MWVVEAIPAGCEISISYIRTFCRFEKILENCNQCPYSEVKGLCEYQVIFGQVMIFVISKMTWICLFLQSELPAAVITGKVWLFLLVHQMQVRPSIMCLDIPSSECKLLLWRANVFCICDTFFNHYVGEHFSDSLSHRLTGEQLQEDDRLRHEVISNVKNQLIFPRL